MTPPDAAPGTPQESIRIAFVEKFGEATARALEVAAEEHEDGVNSANKGTDPFKWALLICIGYECFTKDRYRAYHGISESADDIREWIREHAALGDHDGDCDYISLLAGAYTPYIKAEESNA